MAVEIEFRDGMKAVPNHVGWMLRGIDTHTLTYEEAIKAAETQMLRDHLNRAQRNMIAGHFREHGR